jgi:hypothetical protein
LSNEIDGEDVVASLCAEVSVATVVTVLDDMGMALSMLSPRTAPVKARMANFLKAISIHEYALFRYFCRTGGKVSFGK